MKRKKQFLIWLGLIMAGVFAISAPTPAAAPEPGRPEKFLERFLGSDATAQAEKYGYFWRNFRRLPEVYGQERFASVFDDLAEFLTLDRKSLFLSFAGDARRLYYFTKGLESIFGLPGGIPGMSRAFEYLAETWETDAAALKRIFLDKPHKLMGAIKCVYAVNGGDLPGNDWFGQILAYYTDYTGHFDRTSLRPAFFKEPEEVTFIIKEIGYGEHPFIGRLIEVAGTRNMTRAFFAHPERLRQNLRSLNLEGTRKLNALLVSLSVARDNYAVLFARQTATADEQIEKTTKKLKNGYFDDWNVPQKELKLKEMILSVLSVNQKLFSFFTDEEYGSLVVHILLAARFDDNYGSANAAFQIGHDYFLRLPTAEKIETLAHEIAHHTLNHGGPIGEFVADLGGFAILEHLGFKETIVRVMARWRDRYPAEARARDAKITEEHEAARVELLWITRLLDGEIKWGEYFVKAADVARSDREIIFYDFIVRSLALYLEETGDARFRPVMPPAFPGQRDKMVTPEELRDIFGPKND